MKKLLSLLLVMAMACMMLPVLAEDSLVGTWYLIDVMGMNPADMGLEMSITLNEDGTAAASTVQGGEALEDAQGTWAVEGEQVIITIDGDALAFDIVDGNLQADMGGGTIGTFSREPAEAVKIEIAEVNPDAAAEDFNGSWEAVYIAAQGMILNMEAAMSMGQLDEVPVLTFEDGKFSISGGLSDVFGETDFEMTFDAGVYSYVLTVGDVSMGFYLSLLQDGMLEMKVSMGQEVGLYFVKAE